LGNVKKQQLAIIFIVCAKSSYLKHKNKSLLSGELEVGESYFGSTRKGKRGCGSARKKVPVFGILKRDGQVYTQVLSDAQSKTLIPIIRDKIQPDSIVYSDCWRGYNVLDITEFKHYPINHSMTFPQSSLLCH